MNSNNLWNRLIGSMILNLDEEENIFTDIFADDDDGSNGIITKTKKDIKTFEDVQSFLGSISSINSGGCGIAAYSMYLWLKKKEELPSDFNIVYLHRDYDEMEFESNKAFLEGKGKKVHSCVHAVVKMNGKHVDSKGDYEGVNGFPLTLGIGAEHIDRFMVNSLNKPEWNPRFNRQEYIPAIEEALGVDLSAIKRVLNY